MNETINNKFDNFEPVKVDHLLRVNGEIGLFKCEGTNVKFK